MVKDGSASAKDRAEQVYMIVLNGYTPQELDPDIDARILKYMSDGKRASSIATLAKKQAEYTPRLYMMVKASLGH